MSVERGRISSLLESFGFIYCADRPAELFFHFSSFRGRSDDLDVGDEVEFRVGPATSSRRGRGRGGGGGGGSSGADGITKLAAYDLKLLEPGTVIWEDEDFPGTRTMGRIERPAYSRSRSGGGGGGRNADFEGGGTEGTIRVLLEGAGEGEYGGIENISSADGPKSDQEELSIEMTKAKRGPLVRFTLSDYKRQGGARGGSGGGSNRDKNGNVLSRKDIVEFTLMTDRRSQLKYARNITLVSSEKERLAAEKEQKLLKTAVQEQGIVVTLKNGFGFIRSNRRKEEVYFHFSHIELPEEEKDDSEEEYTLAEGQAVSFLVVDERNAGEYRNDGQKKVSARQIRFVPRGSVKFEIPLAQGVTGRVIERPHPTTPSTSSIGGRGGRAHSRQGSQVNGTPGKVLLAEALDISDNVEARAILGTDRLTEIDLPAHLSPGGTFCTDRAGSRLACWVHEGDVLLFNIVVDCADGICRVEPTTSLVPQTSSLRAHDISGESTTTKENASEKPAVRLIETCLAGRCEGIVHTVKDNYGFIYLAERNAEAYFRLYDVFPNDVNNDIVRNFRPTILGENGDGKISERIIPANTQIQPGMEVTFDLFLQPDSGSGDGQNSSSRRGRGIVGKENLKALRLAIHPTSSILQTKFLALGARGKVTKQDPRQPYAGSIELDEPITKMTSSERHPMIVRLLDAVEKDPTYPAIFHHSESAHEIKVLRELVESRQGKLVLKMPTHNQCMRIISCDAKEVSLDSEDQEHEWSRKEEYQSKDSSRSLEGQDHKAEDVEQKLKTKRPRAVSSVRYDKQGLLGDELLRPPGLTDIVTCDVIQLRRSGAVTAVNVKVIERNYVPSPLKKETEATHVCRGYVLMEPSHTSLANTPSRKPSQGVKSCLAAGSRWSNVDIDSDGKKKQSENVDQGCVLLLEDPADSFGAQVEHNEREQSVQTVDVADNDRAVTTEVGAGAVGTRLFYTNEVIIRSVKSATGQDVDASSAPKRGDLVSFTKDKRGVNTVRDVQVIKPRNAKMVKGVLSDISVQYGTAVMKADEGTYPLKLSEIVSCDPSIVKGGEAVEALVHEGSIYGVCRTKDLYLVSKVGTGGAKERPRLNLTVKSTLGGTIIAQSGMAKGPDSADAVGFARGWTYRESPYKNQEEEPQESADDPPEIIFDTIANDDDHLGQVTRSVPSCAAPREKKPLTITDKHGNIIDITPST